MTTATDSRTSRGVASTVPPFVPHPWFRNGHLQTIAGRYLFGPRVRLASTYHEVELDVGDRVVTLESVPPGWRRGDPSALLIHGLAGCARSPYVVRLGARLWRKGVRVVRMNLRGAGAGFGLARGIYHAGRTDDLRRVAAWMARRAPDSPIALVGYSLGASLVLRLAAESCADPLPGLDCVVAANPPIDLSVCTLTMQRRENRIYDRNFIARLRSDIARLHAVYPDLGPVTFPKVLTIFDFDDLYTAPRNGFAGASDYYARSSVAPLIPGIRLPGLVVHSEDDPFIPVGPFRSVTFPPQLALELIPGGGHLGYLSRAPWMGDHRWLDSRLTEWMSGRWSLNSDQGRGVSS